jgi:nucleoside-diphosphate-sugar epimerase
MAGGRRRRVLVTGAGGRIGTILRAGLGAGYEVHGVDARRSKRLAWKHADLKRLRTAVRATSGCEAVVDLAADPSPRSGWGTVYGNNVAITWNVLEAACQQGVERLVFASSNHVVGLFERDEPYASIVTGHYEGLTPETVPLLDSRAPIRPDSPYGVGKALGEAAARYFAEEHGLSVVCLRIGTVTASGRPGSVRELATLLTHGDLVRLVRSSLEAPADLRFGIYYGVSANTWRIWDIEEAARDLGYDPHDDAEAWRNDLAP